MIDPWKEQMEINKLLKKAIDMQYESMLTLSAEVGKLGKLVEELSTEIILKLS